MTVRKQITQALVIVLMSAFVLPGTYAAIDAYPFPDEALAKRYDGLIAELRCPQCLNTNLAGSDAMIAQDLRREVHSMLLAGKTDDEILNFMHERYGDFILYDPRMSMNTIVLWLGPLVFFLIAAFVMFRLMSRRRVAEKITDEEQHRLTELLGGKESP